MRHQRRIFVSIACLLALASEVPDAAEPLPLEAFASPSQMLAPDMSPDGRHVVFIDRSEPEASVAVMDVDTGRTSKVLSGATDNYRVSYCQFKNDTRVICHFIGWMKAGGGVGLVSRMVAINIDRSDLKLLSQYGNESLHQDEIIDLLRDDPRNVLLQLYEENAKSPSVFKMDVYSAKLERVVKGMEPVLNWNTDRAGAVRFGWGFAGIEPFYKTRDSEAAAWRILHPKNAFEGKEFLVYGFGVQPDKLVVSSPLNGRVAVWEMELGGSNDRQLLFSSPQFDIAGPVVWPSDGRLVGFAYYGEKPQLELFDEQARSVQAAIEKLLPGTTARVVAGSRSGQRLVIASSGDRQPLQYYLLDLQAKSLRLLRRNAPLLTTERLAEMKPVAFPGTDGVPIPAYLMLPPGAEAKNLPAVVLPHGEQFSRDIWGFDAIAQMLVSRGYAVLRINYRGTGGYGHEWLQAGYRNAGAVMVSDINAGTRWLVSQGFADPQRICVMGWNTAGYAALLGSIRAPSLYRCVVSIAGISNLKEQVWGRRYFFFGDRLQIPLKDDETGEDASPVKHASQLKVPVLLIHGDLDAFVGIEQSEWMAQALQGNGKDAKFVRIENGDYALAEPQARLALLRELESFLHKNLSVH